MVVTDLNRYLADRHASLPIGEERHVYRHTRLFPGDGILADANLSAVRATVSRPPQDLILHLPRSIVLYGVRPVNLLRKPSRHRGLPACQPYKRYHMGIRSGMSRNTLANANKVRDWRIYADFAQTLIHIARRLYVDEEFGVELDNTVYALDATTIDLCLSVFPWANFRQTKSAIKLHTLLDLRGSIPTFLHISEGKVHDVNIRAKSNLQFRRLYSHPVDKTTGLHCDQTIVLTGLYSAQHYPEKLRRITYYDAVSQKTFVFLTNNFTLPALTIADLYRCCWQVELFFKWIKQHLQVKAFYSTSENAVKTKIWIAVSVYVPVANIKERLNIKPSLYTILKSLSVAVFEKMPLIQILTDSDNNEQTPGLPNH